MRLIYAAIDQLMSHMSRSLGRTREIAYPLVLPPDGGELHAPERGRQ